MFKKGDACHSSLQHSEKLAITRLKINNFNAVIAAFSFLKRSLSPHRAIGGPANITPMLS
jgi:hypothetical protein